MADRESGRLAPEQCDGLEAAIAAARRMVEEAEERKRRERERKTEEKGENG